MSGEAIPVALLRMLAAALRDPAPRWPDGGLKLCGRLDCVAGADATIEGVGWRLHLCADHAVERLVGDELARCGVRPRDALTVIALAGEVWIASLDPEADDPLSVSLPLVEVARRLGAVPGGAGLAVVRAALLAPFSPGAAWLRALAERHAEHGSRRAAR